MLWVITFDSDGKIADFRHAEIEHCDSGETPKPQYYGGYGIIMNENDEIIDIIVQPVS